MSNSALSNIVGVGVPAGGTTGQVLTKTSNADYTTAWHTGSSSTDNRYYTANDTWINPSPSVTKRVFVRLVSGGGGGGGGGAAKDDTGNSGAGGNGGNGYAIIITYL